MARLQEPNRCQFEACNARTCNQEIVKFYTKLLNILASPAILYGEWKPISVLGECRDRIVAWKMGFE
ncbi:hypothetical protein M9Y10_010853 [Tritrichomonas musculus]|uniref:Uncharacterized protein n=1 Tax=Tritrichomonas musculus TaxID=1915356 RepID=A0ABR2IN49_9EUKA